MSPRTRPLRLALTIARRDFTATVFTPLFLLFLLSPMVMIGFGVVGALGGSTLARGPVDRSQIVAIAAPADATALRAADTRLRTVFRPEEAPPPLITLAAASDPDAQAHRIFTAASPKTSAILYGPLAHPIILYGRGGERTASYLATLAETVLQRRAAGDRAMLSHPIKLSAARRPAPGGDNQASFFAVTGMFFLTLFLSGQAVGTMAEERGNKVIEILAAAAPLESVFLGKLIGMFGVAVLFIAFWGTLLAGGSLILPGGADALASVTPAVGRPAFVMLFFAYFTMAYMLLGAVFLGVGAQASTMREIQMLSLPITIVQMAMFGLASAAAGAPGGSTATFAEIFPLSSPFAMAARAANSPGLWPHLAALAWQALWVGVAIAISARAFRRGVLKSSGPKFDSARGGG